MMIPVCMDISLPVHLEGVVGDIAIPFVLVKDLPRCRKDGSIILCLWQLIFDAPQSLAQIRQTYLIHPSLVDVTLFLNIQI
jgi:hypothetical protein